MSIVACPQCGKRVSSLAPICDRCGYEKGATSEEDLQRFRARRLRDQVYRLNMASYAAIAVVILAFAWYWAGTGGFQVPLSNNGPYYLFGAGAVAYLVVRALLFRARRQQKINRRSK